jgi:peptidyl-tRNA hydrolase, PTH1 family
VDLLVAGLGNPGSRYARTRHNLGYLVAAELASRWGAPPEREKHGGALSEVRLDDGTTVALLRPLGFMNLSGGPVQKAVRAYGLGPEQLVCVHDEVELPFAEVRAKLGGGLSGHNGLRSVADRLGTRDFGRVRCGIGRQRPGDRRDLADWVLSPFEPDEDPAPIVAAAADCVELIARDGIEAAVAV